MTLFHVSHTIFTENIAKYGTNEMMLTFKARIRTCKINLNHETEKENKNEINF